MVILLFQFYHNLSIFINSFNKFRTFFKKISLK